MKSSLLTCASVIAVISIVNLRVVSAQAKFDQSVVCRQKHIVDSMLTLLSNRKDVSAFFDNSNFENAEYFKHRMALLTEGFHKNKSFKVVRTVEVWSKLMLPAYKEEYYFQMKKDRMIIVSCGFTASSKFEGWDKIVNFHVTETTSAKLVDYERSKDDISMPYSPELEGLTLERVPFDVRVCE